MSFISATSVGLQESQSHKPSIHHQQHIKHHQQELFNPTIDLTSPSSGINSKSSSRQSTIESKGGVDGILDRRPTLPPKYDSIATPPIDTLSPQAQQTRNQEKQALRDAWARRDARLTQSQLVQPGQIHHAPPSSVTDSSNSASTSSGGGELVAIPAQFNPDYTFGSTPARTTSSGSTGGGILPPGMDVREALAKCEDPTLGWSMQFWVTIADPLTQHVFFACPASGHCSWDPPIGAFIVPRSAVGEWWELADATRNNRSYYYNTLTSKTQWTRPGGDAFVIPLGLIQRNALPARPSSSSNSSKPSLLTLISASSTSSRQPSHQQTSAPTTPRSGSRITPSGPSRQASGSTIGPLSPPLLTPTLSFPEAMPTGSSQGLSTSSLGRSISDASDLGPPGMGERTRTYSGPFREAKTLSIVDEGSGNETDRCENEGSSGSWWDRRKSRAVAPSPKKGKSKAKDAKSIVEEAESSTRETSLDETLNGSQPMPVGGSELSKVEPLEPIFVESSMRTKRMSTGLHPLLPNDISSQIQSFQKDDFAFKYFATKRTGVLRQKVPLERIMEWQRQPITSPLLVLSRNLTKDALTVFRVIQHVMGERDKPVENAKPTTGSSTSLTLPLVGKRVEVNGEGVSRITNRHGSAESSLGSGFNEEKMVVLEEIRWMIQLGVANGEMRDEIYCQLVKQLTKNPEHDAVVLGFQLFCVLVHAFGPSKNFEVFVKSFLQSQGGQGTDGITVMAKYCQNKLDVMAAKGGRGRTLTIGEIEHASDAAFYPSVYGEALDKIMELQSRSYPSLKVPVILPFLADGILALGGLQSEGIFRVPGDGDLISELKSRIDRGHYQLKGIEDPHVIASLFKLWLRELDEPVIPTNLYNAALTASKSTAESLSFVSRLPTVHRRVLLFVISFFQLFLNDEVVNVTKMTPQNLSLVLAPNLLRTTSNHLVTVFTNSSFESRFVLQLLQHLHPGDVDPEYIPHHGKLGQMQR